MCAHLMPSRTSCAFCRQSLPVVSSKPVWHQHPMWPDDKICEACVDRGMCLACERRSDVAVCPRCMSANPVVSLDKADVDLALSVICFYMDISEQDHILRGIPINMVDDPSPGGHTYGVTTAKKVRIVNRQVLWGPEAKARKLVLNIRLRKGLPRVLTVAFLAHEYVHAFLHLRRFSEGRKLNMPGSLEEGICHVIFLSCLSAQKAELAPTSWAHKVVDFWQRKILFGESCGELLRVMIYLLHSVDIKQLQSLEEAREVLSRSSNTWPFLLSQVVAGKKLSQVW